MNRFRRRLARVALAGLAAVSVLVLLGACAAGPNPAATGGPDAAGFWLGLWQGLISPITFIVSLFNDQVNIYEVHNNGNWYDFGFMLGVRSSSPAAGAGPGLEADGPAAGSASSPRDAA